MKQVVVKFIDSSERRYLVQSVGVTEDHIRITEVRTQVFIPVRSVLWMEVEDNAAKKEA
jgi:hypothetical protein